LVGNGELINTLETATDDLSTTRLLLKGNDGENCPIKLLYFLGEDWDLSFEHGCDK